ncbi:MAG: glycoside hydrolase family 172 protein, partial [Bacteroidota bacterium]
GRKENVMLDVDGPGAIVRFWLTTFKRAGNIRIYFDGDTEPEITIPAYDLMKSDMPLGKGLLQAHSSYEAKEKGGSNMYLPMPYAKHCKVTFEDKEPNREPRYYQINYRSYPKGTKVQTFSLKEFATLGELAKVVSDKLLMPDAETTVKGSTMAVQATLQPKQKQVLVSNNSGGAIRVLKIKLKAGSAEDYEQALRSTILKIDFDGQQTVWCPIGDFGGSGVGAKDMHSWYRTIDHGEIISRWVMPFKKSLKITVINLHDNAVNVDVKTTLSKWDWTANTMYFHADWKSQNNLPVKRTEEDKPTDWDLNVITGKGVFMGDVLAVYNHSHKWYGEGDQKLWRDGEKFPSEYGTGAEDYYNTSWAPVVLYQTPFANAPRADNADSFGHNTFTRTRILDRVPFSKSLRYSLETLGWENNASDFAATTYWYGLKGATSNAAKNQILPTKLSKK